MSGVSSRWSQLFYEAALPAVTIPQALSESACVEIRAALAQQDWQVFDVADRGHYEFHLCWFPTSIQERLLSLATEVIGVPLQILAHRWRRLRRGDYGLVKDDDRLRPPSVTTWVELNLDVSSDASAEAQIVVADGEDSFVVSQTPGTVAIVGRTEGSRRFERYLGMRYGAGQVVRLQLWLGPKLADQ